MAQRHRTGRRGSGRRRTAVRAAATCAALVLGAIAVVAGVIPRLAGATPYTVLTSSMRPQLPPGGLVVVRPTDPRDLGVGDVVTYQVRSGDPTVVTHRIVGMKVGVGGEPIFITQGDANPAPDAEPVQAVQIRGRLWYAVPYVGRLNLLLGLDRTLVLRLIALALAVAAFREFVLAARERRRAVPAGEAAGDPAQDAAGELHHV